MKIHILLTSWKWKSMSHFPHLNLILCRINENISVKLLCLAPVISTDFCFLLALESEVKVSYMLGKVSQCLTI